MGRRLEDVILYRVAGKDARQICRCASLMFDEQARIVELAAVRLTPGVSVLAIDDTIEVRRGNDAVYRFHSVTAERPGQGTSCWRGTFDWFQTLGNGDGGHPPAPERP